MKKRELLNLYGALTTIEGRQFSVKFSYFVAKTKVLLKSEVTALEEARKPPEKFVEYDSKRAELAQSLADKDESGRPRIENNNFIITEKVDEFKEKLDKLKEEYKDCITEYEKKIKEFETLLEEDVEYDGPKIDFKDIPENIEASVLEVLISSNLIIEE